MKPFAGLLDDGEIDAIAAFVAEEFILCGSGNSGYHTAENGWPEHEKRNGPAFPFVTGDISLETPREHLTAEQRLGHQLFLGSCINCHEGRSGVAVRWSLAGASAPPIVRRGVETATQYDSNHGPETTGYEDDYRLGYKHDHEDQDEYEAPGQGEHDRPPRLDDPTTVETRGQRLYQDNCAFCHAADGSGQNWIGRFLQPSPSDFRGGEAMTRFDEQHLVAVILEGVPHTSMPAFRSVLDIGQARAIAAYMRRVFPE